MNLIITLFLAASIQAADIPHEDTDFGCTNVNKAEQYRRDFNIDTRSFGGNELCKSQVDTKKLYNDLQIVEEGTFSQSGDNLFIKGFVPQNQYYAWLKSQTRGVERGNDIPAATAYNSGGYFTMQDGWAKLSTLGRVGTIVHEARHTAGYRHFACSYGPYADSRMPGCDTHYGQAGSHGVEMEYYGRVSVRGQNFHPIYKSMARLMAVARSNFVFNTPPMKKREGLLVLTQDQKAYLIADGERVERERPSVQGQLKRTSFGASILSDAKAFVIELYENTGFQPTTKDAYSYYKLLEAEPRAGLVDFEELDRAHRRYVVAVTGDSMYSFDFPNGRWGGAKRLPFVVERTATTLADGTQGYFIINNQGQTLTVDPQTLATRPVSGQWDFNVVNYVNIDGNVLELKGSQIYSQNKSWDMTSDLDVEQMVAVPLYDAFQVQ